MWRLKRNDSNRRYRPASDVGKRRREHYQYQRHEQHSAFDGATSTAPFTHIREYRIPVGAAIVVNGNARFNDALGALEISHEHGPLVSHIGSAAAYEKRSYLSAIVLLGLFVLFAGLSLGYLRADFSGLNVTRDYPDRISWPSAMLGFWIALFATAVFQGLRIRNRVISNVEQMHFAWAMIGEASLQRTAVVTGLVETVKAAAAHEQRALHELALLRSQSEKLGTAKPSAPAMNDVDEAQRRSSFIGRGLWAMREALPQVKTNENFQSLFFRLVRAEDKIASARGFYEDARTILQNRLTMFPDSLFARSVGEIPAFPPSIDAHDAAKTREFLLASLANSEEPQRQDYAGIAT